MSLPSTTERFCRSCERCSGSAIEHCARTSSNCAYKVVTPQAPPEPPGLKFLKFQAGCTNVMFVIGMITVGVSVVAGSFSSGNPLLAIAVAVGVVLVFAFFTSMSQGLPVTQRFIDAQGNTSLEMTKWTGSQKPAEYRLQSLAEPVVIDLTPITVEAPMSSVASAIVMRTVSANSSATMEQAVGVARAVLLGLVARGALQVYQRQIFIGQGNEPLHAHGLTCELVRGPTPDGLAMGTLETRLLNAFDAHPAGTRLPLTELIGAAYNSSVEDPEVHLVALANQSAPPFSPDELQRLHTELDRWYTDLTARYPALMDCWSKEVEKGIRSRQYVEFFPGG